MTGRIVIIGSGMGGIALTRELRKLDAAADILVLTGESGDFYSKPALSNALAAGKTASKLLLTPAAKLAQDLQAGIEGGVDVTDIDAQAKVVRSTRGEFAYDKLVLAVGASQRRLAFAGDGANGVILVKSLAGYAGFRSRLDGATSVAIIGAGLIGCEFANDLRLGGFAVDVYDVSDQPLPRLLPQPAAPHFRSRLEDIGIRFHLGTALARIDRVGAGHALTDDGGVVRRYDVVLSAAGLQPNVALARAAGATIGVGIRTDGQLRTSVPDMFAIGDCAEIDGLFLPYVLPITHGSKALARTLLGEPTEVRYPAMPVVVKTPACPTVVCSPPSGTGDWDVAVGTDGVRGLHADPETGLPDGFFLMGPCVKDRSRLAAQMPGPMSAGRACSRSHDCRCGDRA